MFRSHVGVPFSSPCVSCASTGQDYRKKGRRGRLVKKYCIVKQGLRGSWTRYELLVFVLPPHDSFGRSDFSLLFSRSPPLTLTVKLTLGLALALEAENPLKLVSSAASSGCLSLSMSLSSFGSPIKKDVLLRVSPPPPSRSLSRFVRALNLPFRPESPPGLFARTVPLWAPTELRRLLKPGSGMLSCAVSGLRLPLVTGLVLRAADRIDDLPSPALDEGRLLSNVDDDGVGSSAVGCVIMRKLGTIFVVPCGPIP